MNLMVFEGHGVGTNPAAMQAAIHVPCAAAHPITAAGTPAPNVTKI